MQIDALNGELQEKIQHLPVKYLRTDIHTITELMHALDYELQHYNIMYKIELEVSY